MKLCALRLLPVIRVLALAVFGLGLIACQDSNYSENHPTGTVKVKVPTSVNGVYQLKSVNLDTLQDMQMLRGEAAEFYFSPGVVDGHITGYQPRVHLMRTSDGTYVAEDSMSLQLLGLYANFEGLMKMDEQLGVKDLNVWPRHVAVSAKVVTGTGTYSTDNAQYSGTLDAFLFQPFDLPDLPLTVNAGVTGHEHFHSLFYKLVLRKMGGVFAKAAMGDPHDVAGMEKSMGLGNGEGDDGGGATLSPRDLYHLTLIRGMNEGLADVWGWIYSGDTNFVGRSLKFEGKMRDLTQTATAVPAATNFANDIAPAANLSETLDQAYALGSQYAALMHAVVEKSLTGPHAIAGANEQDLRLRLAQAILRTLPQLVDSYNQLGPKDKLEPSKLIELLSEQIDFLNDDTCDIMQAKVVNDDTAEVCTALKAKEHKKESENDSSKVPAK